MSTVPIAAPHLPRQGETAQAKSYQGGRKLLWTKPSVFILLFFFSAVKESYVTGEGGVEGEGAGPSMASRDT